jgi:hypothetical protein
MLYGGAALLMLNSVFNSCSTRHCYASRIKSCILAPVARSPCLSMHFTNLTKQNSLDMYSVFPNYPFLQWFVCNSKFTFQLIIIEYYVLFYCAIGVNYICIYIYIYIYIKIRI